MPRLCRFGRLGLDRGASERRDAFAGRQGVPPVRVLVHGREFAIGTAADARIARPWRSCTNATSFSCSRRQSAASGISACGDRRAGVADRRHVADHRGVHEHTAMVLTGLHVRLQAILGDRDNDVSVITLASGGRSLTCTDTTTAAGVCESIVARIVPCGMFAAFSSARSSGCRVAADEFRAPVDDHLRRVDAVAAEPCGIHPLALGQGCGREAILPAEPVPVVHVLAQTDDFGSGDRRRIDQLLQQHVGRRTIGAAFRCEQFDDDWSRRRRVRCRGQSCKHEESDGHQARTHLRILV